MRVTFWHGFCLISNRTNQIIIMDFKYLYENAKSKANKFMLNGQISAYVNALKEMNQYKKMMVAVVAN